MDGRITVLMVGSNTKVKGGMTTVVQSFLNHTFSRNIRLDYIATHSEKGRLYNSFYFAKGLISIIYHLLSVDTDILHLHMSDKGSFVRKYMVFKIAKSFGKKVVLHMHGGNFQSFYDHMPYIGKRGINELLRKSDIVIALGSNWERILHRIEPEANIKVLRNAVPLPALDDAFLKKTTFSILFLAVLQEEKGIFDLIKASAGAIKKAEERRVMLVFDIAGDGGQLEQAKQMVDDLGIGSSYCFHGWVGKDWKQKLMRKSDLFVLPSYFEGLPMSILEAISFGIPVISTHVGSIDEAVKEGENGYLIAPGDVETLEERLNLAISNPSLQEFRKASRKLAEERFDENKYFQQIEEMYEGIFREIAQHQEREYRRGRGDVSKRLSKSRQR